MLGQAEIVFLLSFEADVSFGFWMICITSESCFFDDLETLIQCSINDVISPSVPSIIFLVKPGSDEAPEAKHCLNDFTRLKFFCNLLTRAVSAKSNEIGGSKIIIDA